MEINLVEVSQPVTANVEPGIHMLINRNAPPLKHSEINFSKQISK